MEVESPVKVCARVLCRTCNEQPELKPKNEYEGESRKNRFSLSVSRFLRQGLNYIARNHHFKRAQRATANE
jgi:hypothetical protein